MAFALFDCVVVLITYHKPVHNGNYLGIEHDFVVCYVASYTTVLLCFLNTIVIDAFSSSFFSDVYPLLHLKLFTTKTRFQLGAQRKSRCAKRTERRMI